MPTYIEYQLDENSSILIEAPDDGTEGMVKVSREVGELPKLKAKKNFSDALKDIKLQAKLLLKEIEELHVEEAQVKFGINTVGELGNMAIGKIGVGVNYEVTLKWTNPKTRVNAK
jgi:hypothetical protein